LQEKQVLLVNACAQRTTPFFGMAEVMENLFQQNFMKEKFIHVVKM
jgi:hypothetical protein